MSFLFDNFSDWRVYCEKNNLSLPQSVAEYEGDQKGKSPEAIREGLMKAYLVMKDAVQTGLTEDMKSRSGMIDNGGKKVYNHSLTVLSPEFQRLIARALAAKEVNSCMGRVVAAPTAGASGIIPGTLYTLQEIHGLEDEQMVDGLLVSAGIALIIQQKASLSGAVGGCQAETGKGEGGGKYRCPDLAAGPKGPGAHVRSSP
ncbi:MAG: L-serine ammonia-lyase, iron-sulfur-dependent, subunit alpha, partial [Bacteroidetes bacterium]|nr:L-serine ammonia-lyase, iron-sulfur-dependent, subunit alpha [Bacteroidota bacterium]